MRFINRALYPEGTCLSLWSGRFPDFSRRNYLPISLGMSRAMPETVVVV